MHPLLTPINRLGYYLLAWIPLTIILGYLLAAPGGLGWRDATVLVVPLCVIYAFICLSAWYSCKASPIGTTDTFRLFLRHGIAGAIVSLLWVGIGSLLATALAQFQAFSGINRKYSSQTAVIFGAGYLLYGLAVASHYVILALEESQEAQARVLETTVLARDAELRALKAQVNPHFLYNSLNSISALTSIDPAKAREMCILLAEFLRMTLGLGDKENIALSEEISLVHRFLAIEKVRFGAQLQVQEEIEPACQSLLVPALLLQPLVENAVTHGIANSLEGGCIRISARCSEGVLHIVIENTFEPEAGSERRNGLGLANVRQRLQARYLDDASLRVTSDNERFQVSLSLPAIAQEARA